MLEKTLYYIERILMAVQGWLLSRVYNIRTFRHNRFDEPRKRQADATYALLSKQQKCALRGHAKGGSVGGARHSLVHRDANIHMHTFIGGDIKIWCGWCG